MLSKLNTHTTFRLSTSNPMGNVNTWQELCSQAKIAGNMDQYGDENVAAASKT